MVWVILVISGKFNEIIIRNFTLTNVLLKLSLKKGEKLNILKLVLMVQSILFNQWFIYYLIINCLNFFFNIVLIFFLIEFLFYQDYDWPNMVSQMNCDTYANALGALTLLYSSSFYCPACNSKNAQSQVSSLRQKAWKCLH